MKTGKEEKKRAREKEPQVDWKREEKGGAKKEKRQKEKKGNPV